MTAISVVKLLPRSGGKILTGQLSPKGACKMSTPKFASAPYTAGQLNALVKIVGPDNVPGILDGTLKFIIKQPDLLKRFATITVPGVARFVAKDCLKEANVGWLGLNFKLHLCDKIEENVPEAKLVVSRLEKPSLDAPILAELDCKAEVSLAYMFDLLKKQSKGEDDILLTNGYANIFYIRGTDGNLWAVNCRWNSDNRYWDVEANSVEYPYRWNDGNRAFSRDS